VSKISFLLSNLPLYTTNSVILIVFIYNVTTHLVTIKICKQQIRLMIIMMAKLLTYSFDNTVWANLYCGPKGEWTYEGSLSQPYAVQPVITSTDILSTLVAFLRFISIMESLNSLCRTSDFSSLFQVSFSTPPSSISTNSLINSPHLVRTPSFDTVNNTIISLIHQLITLLKLW